MPASRAITEPEPPDRTHRMLRITVFANFFKSYMSASTIVAASIPIPVASLKLIPAYAQQKGYLTVYASLFCFLSLAFVFSIRHRLAKWMFAGTRQSALIALLPAVFIGLTLASILGYHSFLQNSLELLRSLGVASRTPEILNGTDYSEIPYSLALSGCYLGIFFFAELAFVLMAIREYLQDLLGLDEMALIKTNAGRQTS